MKKITAFILCMILFCTCSYADCFAADVEKAVVKALEVPVCVGYAYNCAELDVVGEYSQGDKYVRVRTPDGTEGFADERWLSLKLNNTVAQVRNERVEIFTALLEQGDEVEVISKDSYVTKVIADGTEGEIETRFLRFEGEESFAPREGFAAAESMLFNNPWLRDQNGKIITDAMGNNYSIPNAVSLRSNTPITVLDYLGDCCLVEAEGQIGYLASKFVLPEKINYALWG